MKEMRERECSRDLADKLKLEQRGQTGMRSQGMTQKTEVPLLSICRARTAQPSEKGRDIEHQVL